jgi:L-ascorbate metabolism protein UlaG (beta-lactamase superfamily)
MILHRFLLILGILYVPGCSQDNRKSALEVTYIANEGFMIAMGSTKILIDALPNSRYYVNPSDATVTAMVSDAPPFGGIDYCLVTHNHPDHFSAPMVSRFLSHHPATRFIANSTTYGKLMEDSIAGRRYIRVDLKKGEHQIIPGNKAEILALRLVHDGDSSMNNLAYLVRANGHTIFHVGDARLSLNEEYLRTLDWKSYDVDLLFIEYFDRDTPTQDIIETLLRPKHVILMHIPPGEEDDVRNADGEIHPRTFVFEKQNETRRFDDLTDDGPSH